MRACDPIVTPSIVLALCLAVLAPPLMASSRVAADKHPVLVRSSQARVEIDAGGNVTNVQVDPSLPASIAGPMAENLRKVHFSPAVRDGKPVSGATYVWQDVCLAPQGGEYQIAMRYIGNGPALVQRAFPPFPKEAMRAGESSEWRVEFDVLPDGSSALVGAERTDGRKHGRFDAEFRRSLGAWVRAQTFHPELVDGEPAPTRLREDVAFLLTSTPDTYRQPKAAEDVTCRALLAAPLPSDRRIALNSPFRALDAGEPPAAQ